MTTYLYILQAGDEKGPVKIGHSRNIAKRIESLQTGNPLPIRLLAKVPRTDAAKLERGLHGMLAADRLEGEWFRYSENVANVITVYRHAEETGQ